MSRSQARAVGCCHKNTKGCSTQKDTCGARLETRFLSLYGGEIGADGEASREEVAYTLVGRIYWMTAVELLPYTFGWLVWVNVSFSSVSIYICLVRESRAAGAGREKNDNFRGKNTEKGIKIYLFDYFYLQIMGALVLYTFGWLEKCLNLSTT